jgi:hypothetical protein
MHRSVSFRVHYSLAILPVGFKVLKASSVEMIVLWDVAPCSITSSPSQMEQVPRIYYLQSTIYLFWYWYSPKNADEDRLFVES